MKFGPEKAQRLKQIVEEVLALEDAKAAQGKNSAKKIIGIFEREAGDLLQLQPYWKSDQRERLEEALRDLQAASTWLEDPECDDDCDWYELLIKVMCAASIVSNLAGTFVAKYKARGEQAALARSAKSKTPANVALAAAIDLFREPYERPWKEADRILPFVNKDLRKAGFAAVNVDKIYRRLSALLKNAD